VRRHLSRFATVDDVAHAFKHVVAGNKRKPSLKAQQVIARPPARAGIMIVGFSQLGDPDGAVVLAIDLSVNMLGVVTRAFEFLRGLSERN
jgi:hypothetical protein